MADSVVSSVVWHCFFYLLHTFLYSTLTASLYRDTMRKESCMPVLARFYGVTIRMYFQQAEHNPPHIHAIYNNDVAAICIKDG